MEIGPVCAAARVLGHSWPGPHWWLTLTAADQGAWVSGLGALVAVAATVVMAIRSERRARHEGADRDSTLERVVAIQAQKPLIRVSTGCAIAANMLQRMVEGRVRWKIEILRLPAEDDLAALADRAYLLSGAPATVIAAVVAIQTEVTRHNEMVGQLIEAFGESADKDGAADLARILSPQLNKVRAALADAVTLFGKHDPRIAAIIRDV